MRRHLSVVVVVGALVGVVGQAHADRRRNTLPGDATVRHRALVLGSCDAVAISLTVALDLDASAKLVLQRRCDTDRWTADSRSCFAKIASPIGAGLCLDTLSKVQRKAIEGDADRLADARLSRWLMRRTFGAPAAPVVVTLASYSASQDVGNARTLHSKAMSAYQAGRYDVASKSFSAAISASPTADNVYLAAQSYRMKGERAKALELYERYLEIAPSGPAAPACRYQIERLRDSNP
jgi:tetratricopeptide (TPR) repeat protein